MAGAHSIVAESLELTDPIPDIYLLFQQFNRDYFWNTLGSVVLSWSPRMTSTAGLCKYEKGMCSIALSKPLLTFRPRRDLVETLLHEMIHAYNILIERSFTREQNPHGQSFKAHMDRINKLTGTRITIYHSFHDEVKLFQQHWWRCTGPCQNRHPYYGYVKRSMNRAPGPSDFWHEEHKRSCGGAFIKIREPPPKEKASEKKRKIDDGKNQKITKFLKTTETSSSTSKSLNNDQNTSKYSIPVPKVSSSTTNTNTNTQPSTSTSVNKSSTISTSHFPSTGGYILGSSSSNIASTSVSSILIETAAARKIKNDSSGKSNPSSSTASITSYFPRVGGNTLGSASSSTSTQNNAAKNTNTNTVNELKNETKTDKEGVGVQDVGQVNGYFVQCPYCRSQIKDEDEALVSHLNDCNEVKLLENEGDDGDVFIDWESFTD